jgi:hypothetical protein
MMMMKEAEKALIICERNIFRRIYGAKYDNRDWKSSTKRTRTRRDE